MLAGLSLLGVAAFVGGVFAILAPPAICDPVPTIAEEACRERTALKLVVGLLSAAALVGALLLRKLLMRRWQLDVHRG